MVGLSTAHKCFFQAILARGGYMKENEAKKLAKETGGVNGASRGGEDEMKRAWRNAAHTG